jgi:hypothetical protein
MLVSIRILYKTGDILKEGNIEFYKTPNSNVRVLDFAVKQTMKDLAAKIKRGRKIVSFAESTL